MHQRLVLCHRCVDADLLPRAAPVFNAPRLARVALVGQAPGPREEQRRLTFSGPSGRRLFTWLSQAGWPDEETARRQIYMSSITKCYPGRAAGGHGDRVPSATEVELCREHLDVPLIMLGPALVILVGGAALRYFWPQRVLTAAIGGAWDAAGRTVGDEPLAALSAPVFLPLPHPSGASTWPNLPGNAERLATAIGLLARWRAELNLEGRETGEAPLRAAEFRSPVHPAATA